MTRNRGFSLVELLVVLSVGSVLLVLGMRSIHRAMDIASRARVLDREEKAATRLSRQFRTDIHQAEAFSILGDDGEQAVLQIETSAGAVVRYQKQNDTLQREESKLEQKSFEGYVLPDESIVLYSANKNPERVVLKIESETGLVPVPRRLFLHVEAAIGLHHVVPSAERIP